MLRSSLSCVLELNDCALCICQANWALCSVCESFATLAQKDCNAGSATSDISHAPLSTTAVLTVMIVLTFHSDALHRRIHSCCAAAGGTNLSCLQAGQQLGPTRWHRLCRRGAQEGMFASPLHVQQAAMKQTLTDWDPA